MDTYPMSIGARRVRACILQGCGETLRGGCALSCPGTPALGEHKPGRFKPGRIKRAALSLQNHNYHIFCFLIRPCLYASDSPSNFAASTGWKGGSSATNNKSSSTNLNSSGSSSSSNSSSWAAAAFGHASREFLGTPKQGPSQKKNITTYIHICINT